MTTQPTVEVLDEGAALQLTWPSGGARFHAVWLRDNALDDETRSAANGQRLITLQDIPLDTHIGEAMIAGALLTLRFEPEGKEVSFPIDWLRAHAYDRTDALPFGRLPPGIAPWTGTFDPTAVSGDLNAIKTSAEARRDWLKCISRYGFATLTGGPIESGALLKIADLFGFVRETNYGKWFEVRTEVCLLYTSPSPRD